MLNTNRLMELVGLGAAGSTAVHPRRAPGNSARRPAAPLHGPPALRRRQDLERATIHGEPLHNVVLKGPVPAGGDFRPALDLHQVGKAWAVTADSLKQRKAELGLELRG